MKEAPEDIDDRYRRASAQDPSRPSESVRRAVLEHARRLAVERAQDQDSIEPFDRVSRDRAAQRSRRGWRLPILGTLAAAAIAGLLITPRFLESPVPPAPTASMSAPAPSMSAPAPSMSAPTATTVAPPAPPVVESRESDAAPRPAPPSPASRQWPSRAQAELQAQRSVAQAYAPRALTAAPSPSARAPDFTAALQEAAQAGDTARLASLLEQSGDVNARDSSGRSTLLLAAQFGRSDTVDWLLAHGADPNAADAQGTTPLQAALAGHYAKIAAALRRAGAR